MQWTEPAGKLLQIESRRGAGSAIYEQAVVKSKRVGSKGIDSNRLFGVSPAAAPFLVLRGRPHSLKRRGIVHLRHDHPSRPEHEVRLVPIPLELDARLHSRCRFNLAAAAHRDTRAGASYPL